MVKKIVFKVFVVFSVIMVFIFFAYVTDKYPNELAIVIASVVIGICAVYVIKGLWNFADEIYKDFFRSRD